MKQTLTTSHAASILAQDENANWSYSGATALIEYLEEIDEDMEFDAVALRCEYSERASLIQWSEDYFIDHNVQWSDTAPEDLNEAIRDYINDHGQLIEFDGGIIVSSF